MNNVILDSFKWSTLRNFLQNFDELNFNIKYVSYHGNTHLNHDDLPYEIEFMGTHEISRGTIFRNTPWVLTNADIASLSQYEGVFINMLSRDAITPAHWSATEMSEHYYFLLNFWYYKIVQLKIDKCIGFFTPHESCSFSLYLLSKYLKLPYIFIDTPIVAGRIRFLSCSYGERNLLIRTTNNSNGEWVRKILRNYGVNLKENFHLTTPPEMKQILSSQSNKRFIPSAFRILNFCKSIKKSILDGINLFVEKPKRLSKIPWFLYNHLFPRGPTIYKITRFKWIDDKAVFARLNWFIFRWRMRLSLWLKRQSYQNLCTEIPENLSYIYFAAPLQPEASTLPVALWNSHISIFLKRLIDVIPNDWKIVYKVNPAQFSTIPSSSTYIQWQRPDFYSELTDSGRVILAPDNAPTVKLIDGAMGVACINGTVAIEAIHRGKRCITVSPMWYDQLDGIHCCGSRADFVSAIRLMEIGVVANPNIEEASFSDDSVFDAQEYIENEFSNDNVAEIARKIKRSFDKFDQLDGRKWAI